MKMETLKIVFFTVETGAGGAERVISTLCNKELSKDCKISILSIIDGEWFFPLPPAVKKYGILTREEYEKNGRIKTLPSVCRKYYSIISILRPDIILAFLPEPCFIAGYYKNRLGIPVIGSERGNPYYIYRKPIYKFLANFFYGRLDGFVFQTEGARDFFCRKVQGISKIIVNPIKEEEYVHDDSHERRREIVAIGRSTPEKNYPMLIRVFSKIREDHPDYVLRIYGEYNEEDDIVRMINEMKMRDCIFLEGKVSNVKERIMDAGMYILTSISEGMPNALMEAMSLGLPVIAADCPSGGPKALIEDGINGILIKNNDEKGAIEAIKYYICNPQKAENMGKEAAKVKNTYSEKVICRQWMDFICKIIVEHKHAW